MLKKNQQPTAPRCPKCKAVLPRCQHCGVIGHSIKECELKKAGDREIAKERARRIREGLDPDTGRRL